MLELLALSALLCSDLQDISAELHTAQLKLESVELSDFDPDPTESKSQAQKSEASVSMQFGVMDMMDADELGVFSALQLDLPVGENWLVECQIGSGKGDPGFTFTYFSAGAAREYLIGKSGADRWTLRPFAHLIYQMNEATVTAEEAHEVASMRPNFIDNFVVTAEDSFGFLFGSQLVWTHGRLDVSATLGYRIMKFDADGYGLVNGTTPVLVSVDDVDMSGIVFGISVGYRF